MAEYRAMSGTERTTSAGMCRRGAAYTNTRRVPMNLDTVPLTIIDLETEMVRAMCL